MHHALPICCLASVPQFHSFANNPNQDHRIDFENEYQIALHNFRDLTREPNHRQRQRLYRQVFLALDFGLLMPGERRRLPNCVCAKIRSLYPDESKFYMEFK